MDLVASLVMAMAVGFGTGFLAFKRSLQWCPECGSTLRCRECPSPQASGAIADPEPHQAMPAIRRF